MPRSVSLPGLGGERVSGKKVGPLGRPRVQGGREEKCKEGERDRDGQPGGPCGPTGEGLTRWRSHTRDIAVASLPADLSRAPAGSTDMSREDNTRRSRPARSRCAATRRSRALRHHVAVERWPTSAPEAPVPQSPPRLATPRSLVPLYRAASVSFVPIALRVRDLVRTPLTLLYVHPPECQPFLAIGFWRLAFGLGNAVEPDQRRLSRQVEC